MADLFFRSFLLRGPIRESGSWRSAAVVGKKKKKLIAAFCILARASMNHCSADFAYQSHAQKLRGTHKISNSTVVLLYDTACVDSR
jgi:hypothetical protein